MNETVAVLMPVRENEPFLRNALESLQDQDHRFWHCYVVADGDSRVTEEVLSQSLDASQYSVLRYPIHKRGLAAGLNFGLRGIREELVARFDSDDVCLPNRLREQVRQFVENEDLCMVAGLSDKMNSSGIRHTNRLDVQPSLPRKELLAWFNPITHSSVMFRRSVVMKAGGYNPIARGCEDYDLWLRLLARSDQVSRLKVIDHPVVLYREHEQQLTKRSMVGLQLRVVSASRGGFLASSGKGRIHAVVSNLIWSGWQRLRYP